MSPAARSRAPHGVLRLWDEFLFVLRRGGLTISTAQAETALCALALVGFDDPWTVRETLAATLVQNASDRARFDAAFREHFRPGLRGRTLLERLEALGLSASERSAIHDWMQAASNDDPLLVWIDGGATRDDWLARSRALRMLEGEHDASRAGFLLHQIMTEARLPKASLRLDALALYLRDALGEARAAEVTAMVRAELAREAQRLRRTLRERVANDEQQPTLARAQLPTLSPQEIRLAERAVLALAERLLGRARVRARRRRRGRIDMRATLQRSKATFGVPMQLVRRARRRDPAKLLVLCDVSESVRAVARYLLLFLYHTQNLWRATRTFVFVSDLAETTEVFRREGAERALALAYGGSVVATSHNSNYGRALASFEAITEIDRNTSVLILGDGRSNFLDPGLEVMQRLKARARSVLWLCPEPASSWGRGDSRMPEYAHYTDRTLPVDTLEALERAMRTLPSL